MLRIGRCSSARQTRGLENSMKRQIPSMALIASLLLLLFTGLTPRSGARLQHPRRSAGQRKTSAELVHRINKGRGDELVSVIVQPAQGWDYAIDSAAESSGATTTHR